MNDGVLPHGEQLRRAVRWLSEQGRHDAAAVEDAAQRFDLTPLEEEFLLRHFTTHAQNRSPEGGAGDGS